MAGLSQQGKFFTGLQTDPQNFDAEKFLTEVESQFQSGEIANEVRWRLAVLKEISARPEFKDVQEGLRNRLTQIFSKGGEEQEVLSSLKGLTEVKREDGEAIELRRFLKRSKRTLTEMEYRTLLAKKLENTVFQALSLGEFFPEAVKDLKQLQHAARVLIQQVENPTIATQKLKEAEDSLRETPAFQAYESFKNKFLRDWLAQFGGVSAEEIAGMAPEEIQQMVREHERHQMTQLLKTQINPSPQDMTEHLGLHDTLEGTFGNEDFWSGANIGVKSGFKKWVMQVVQSFGMLKGQRYAFFQSKESKNQFLLFGMGFATLPDSDDEPMEMVPYIKPFTLKAGYLLEIRNREMGDPEEYAHELRHYVLPFLFGFDQMREFKISKELISFFTSGY